MRPVTVISPTAAVPANAAGDGGTQPGARTVYALEQAGRNNVYCGSAFCVSKLLAQGWRLSDPGQLAALVRDLATGRATFTHDPSDHFT